METRARYPSRVRIIAVDAEVRKWSRRRGIGFVPVKEEWVTTVAGRD